jgi:hypothetical protein
LSFASSHNKNARFGFEQSYKHAKYFCFVFSILSIISINTRYKRQKEFDCAIHIHGAKSRIYIPAKSKKILIQIVKPHMIPSMYYKLGEKVYSASVEGTLWNSKTLLRTEVFDFNSNTNKVSKVKYYSTFSPARKNNTHLSVRQVYSNFGFINLNLNNTGFYEKEKHHFGSYLAGLLEGDGHIYINKNGSKVKNYSLSITFNLKDLPLAENLKDVIGFG